MHQIITPKPWPPERWPTPEEFRAWFLMCSEQEQLVIATITVRGMQDADRLAQDVMRRA